MFATSLRRGSFSRNVGVLIGGTAAAQGITLLASPLLSRLFSPSDFGHLAIFSSAMAIASAAATLRFEIAVPLAKGDGEALSLVWLSVASSIIVALAFSLMVWMDPGHLTTKVTKGLLHGTAAFLFIGTIGTGCYQALSFWAIRKKRYKVLAQTRLSQSAAQVALQLVCGLGNAGAIGLILGDVAGRIAGCGRLARGIFHDQRTPESPPKLGRFWRVAGEYKRFPLLSLPSALLNVLGLQLPVLVLAAYYSESAVGSFAFAHRLMAAPVTLLARSAGQVFLGEAAPAIEDRERLLRLFLKLTSTLLIVAAVPALLLALAGPKLFEVAFGPEWQTAGEYARYLAPVFIGQFVLSPVGQTFNILNLLGHQLIWDVSRLASIGAVVLAAANGGGPEKAVLAYSAVQSVLYILLFCAFVTKIRNG